MCYIVLLREYWLEECQEVLYCRLNFFRLGWQYKDSLISHQGKSPIGLYVKAKFWSDSTKSSVTLLVLVRGFLTRATSLYESLCHGVCMYVCNKYFLETSPYSVVVYLVSLSLKFHEVLSFCCGDTCKILLRLLNLNFRCYLHIIKFLWVRCHNFCTIMIWILIFFTTLQQKCPLYIDDKKSQKSQKIKGLK